MEEAFREMEEMMSREFRDLTKRIPKDLARERILSDGTKINEWGPFVYGYSMTIGPDGKPQIREFGNMKPQKEQGARRPRIDFKEEREPLVDVVRTDGEVKVVVELPGVEKEQIKLNGTEESLTISVDATQRKYYKEITLPTKVEPKEARSSYRNGVLEITLITKKEEKPKGEEIRID